MSIAELNGKEFELQNLGISCSFSTRNVRGDDVLLLLVIEESEDDSLIQEFGVFEVTSVASNIAKSQLIEIEDEAGDVFANLLIGSSDSRNIETSGSIITAYILYYALMDKIRNGLSISQVSNTFSQNEYIEDRSLLLVEATFVDEYVKSYKSGSEFWGGFSHRVINSVATQSISRLSAKANIHLPTNEHETKAFYAVSSENTFTRFLNKYHIIELLFNYLIVARLRVAKSDIREFRDIMSSYSQGKEIELLRTILILYVTDANSLAQNLYSFGPYKDLAEKVFQNSKGGENPLKKDDVWDKFWKALTDLKLSRADIEADKLLKFQDVSSDQKFLEIICKITSYWIYRVRCSIAHSKISEFIFADSDEVFVLNAAEPLLDEVISQLLTNSELQAILKNSKRVEEYLYPPAQ
ncbi:MAG: hypothetical protein ABJM70_21910 [Ekhidna sp.]